MALIDIPNCFPEWSSFHQHHGLSVWVQKNQAWKVHCSRMFTALDGTRCQNSGGFTDMVPLSIYILQSKQSNTNLF